MLVNRCGKIGLPEYKTAGAACADLQADVRTPVVINPGERVVIPCGIKVEIPEGYEIQARGRSGLSMKHGIAITHGVGTVDSDFRGEMCAILINHGGIPYVVRPGDRIMQIKVAPVVQAVFVAADELSETERGEEGYGSTGK